MKGGRHAFFLPRVARGKKVDAKDRKGFEGRFGKREVPAVNRVEGASQKSKTAPHHVKDSSLEN